MVGMVGDVARAFFSGVWRLLLQTDYPGVGVSVAGVMISFLLIRLSISLFQYLSGFGAGGGDYGRASDHMDRYRYQRRWRNGRLLPPHRKGRW